MGDDRWPTVTIDEIKASMPHSTALGPFGSTIRAENFVPSGVPVVRGLNLNVERFKDECFVFISDEKANELHSANASPGDLVFVYVGTIGQVGIIPRNASYPRYIISQNLMKLTCDPDKADPLYVYYYFRSPTGQHSLLLSASSTGVPIISRPLTSLRAIRILLPPLSEQHTIAHILGTLDDKIELNRQVNHTLEAIARTLFKSWFVDFDPVCAKAEGRQPYGMDAETAALFPGSFEDSPMGEIPKGWRVITIGEVVTINGRNVTKDYPYQTIKYIDISSVAEGRLEGTTNYYLVDAPSRAKRLVRQGDCIWSTVRPNRKSYLFIHNPEDNLVVSTGFAVLTPRSIPPSYLYAWVTTDQFVDYLAYNADGSAYPAVLPDRFADGIILLPPAQILQEFERQVGPIRELIAQNEDESRTLAAIRDALLPKLLSGEIRVKDART
jgi:type I restriction enzyme S subunit